MKLPKPIIQFLDWFPRQEFALLLSALFVVGLIGGRALMSIAMISLFANTLINIELKENLNRFISNQSAVMLCGLFLLIGVSYLWSENIEYYGSRMQLFLPFLALPIAFQSIKWKKIYFDFILILFVVICFIGAGWSIVQYMSDKESIDAAYKVSKSLPTPFGGDHIRFGVAVVIAISFCVQFIKEKSKGSLIFALVGILLIAYSHILASKTALLSLYIVLFYELLQLILQKKKIALGFGIMTLLFVLPFLFYYVSDSFKTKIDYTTYSFEQFFNEKSETNFSDEGRLISYETALRVVKKNWLIGVGVGDGLDAMQSAYSANNISTEKILYPHNQFLYMALILGLIGFVYLVVLVFYLFKKYFSHSAWLASFLLVFIIPLNVEAFFNTQYGIALFLFFFLLLERKYRLGH